MKKLPSLIVVSALTVTAMTSNGCKWTDFDDIQDTTWAVSLQKPSAVSTTGDWGYGLVSSRGTSGVNNPFLVVGRNDASVAAVNFNANGGEVVLNTVSNPSKIIGPPVNIGGHPLIAMTADGAGAAVLAGSTVQFWTGSQFEAIPVTSTIPNAIAVAITADVTNNKKVFVGTDMGVSENGAVVPICMTGTKVIAMATSSLGLLAWQADGTNEIYTAVPTCMKNPVANKFGRPGEGIVVVVETATIKHAILGQFGTAGEIFVIDLVTNTLISSTPAPGLSALAAATMLTKTGSEEVIVAGFKDTIVEGIPNAGEAKLYFVEGAMITEQGSLFDASPENDQNFGRTVATTELDGKPVILIGADDEVFAYFETSLFANSRPK